MYPENYYDELLRNASPKEVFNKCNPFKFRLVFEGEEKAIDTNKAYASIKNKTSDFYFNIASEGGKINPYKLNKELINKLHSESSQKKLKDIVADDIYSLVTPHFPSIDKTKSHIEFYFFLTGDIHYDLKYIIYSNSYRCLGMDNNHLFYINDVNRINSISVLRKNIEYLGAG